MKSIGFVFFLIIPISINAQQVIHGKKELTAEQSMRTDCDRRVFYEIFIRSFYDSNGDGIGDLNGITAKLDYMQQLGIGGLWLTPFNPSPSYHKYDVTDYYSVDPEYGTLDDFKKLVSEAHRRDILVLMDLVVNHTSEQHPWFKAAITNDPKYREYYVWEKNPAATREGGWYKDRDSTIYAADSTKYYAYFWRGMPDLNFDNPEVRREIIKTGLWWLKETKIDGYRLDAAQHVYDPDNPEKNIVWWKEFTDALKQQKPDVITVGECWNTYNRVAQYLPALSGAFNFQLSWVILRGLQTERGDSIGPMLTLIRKEYEKYAPDFIDPIFLSNHDNNRIMSDLKNNEYKAKLVACIYLTLPGTPFIYYGEEIGMKGMKPDNLIREPFLWDAKGRDPHQTSWEKSTYSTDDFMKPLSAQLQDTSSFYFHYKTLIDFRKKNDAITSQDFIAADLNNSQLLAYVRGDGNEALLVIHNLSEELVEFSLPEDFKQYAGVIFSSPEKLLPDVRNLILRPFSTIILRRG
ncbi:MAG: alpha-amylase family glycosyl hydrolase [Chitinophagales bacterium]